MSRTLSSAARAALYAEQTDEAFLVLLTLEHASMDEPIRVSSDAVATVSRGDSFVAYPFDLQLPDDADGRPPRARLTIDNVDRTIVLALRQLDSPPRLTIEIVRAADPDTVEASFAELQLLNVSYDAQTVTGELGIEDISAEPYPAHDFVPSLAPGLF